MNMTPDGTVLLAFAMGLLFGGIPVWLLMRGVVSATGASLGEYKLAFAALAKERGIANEAMGDGLTQVLGLAGTMMEAQTTAMDRMSQVVSRDYAQQGLAMVERGLQHLEAREMQSTSGPAPVTPVALPELVYEAQARAEELAALADPALDNTNL